MVSYLPSLAGLRLAPEPTGAKTTREGEVLPQPPYCYERDTTTPSLALAQRPEVEARPYQLEAVMSMQDEQGCAKSGIVILPCGGGKTLVGVLATALVRKNTLVLCNTQATMFQWQQQYTNSTTVDPSKIYIVKKKTDSLPAVGESAIVITTYALLGFKNDPEKGKAKANKDEIAMTAKLAEHEWGLAILDEAHFAAAKTYLSTFTEKIKPKCKIGLTATLVREDGGVEQLLEKIGPIISYTSVPNLQACEAIATVAFIQYYCELDEREKEIYETPDTLPLLPKRKPENRSSVQQRKNRIPHFSTQKITLCRYLFERHRTMGDKVLIFSHDMSAFNYLEDEFAVPAVNGDTDEAVRLQRYTDFRSAPAGATLLLSDVGDVGVDLPDANVIIEYSGHGSSRMKVAQRVGRIQRRKEPNNTATFYSLAVDGTQEVDTAMQRNRFLTELGYEIQKREASELAAELSGVNLLHGRAYRERQMSW